MICCCQHVEGQQIVVDAEPSTGSGLNKLAKLLDEEPDYRPHEINTSRELSPSPPPLGESGLAAAADLAGLWDLMPEPSSQDVEATHVPLTLGLFDGGEQTVYLSMRPLDLYFQKSPPFVVRGVRGHAADLGILPGSVLKTVGDVNLRERSDLDAMCQAVSSLPLKIRMVLQPADDSPLGIPAGKCKTVFVTSRPLGLEFKKVPPFSIEAVTAAGHADQLGLQQGWFVKQIGCTELTVEADVQPALALLALLPVL